MRITKVFLNPTSEPADMVRFYVTIYIDDAFAVHDIRAMKDGRIFMPARQKTRRCGNCNYTSRVTAVFCEHCGRKLTPLAYESPFFDVAHPLDTEARLIIESAIKRKISEQCQASLKPSLAIVPILSIR